MNSIWLEIDPMPKPRATQRDRWKPSKSTIRYRAFADALRAGIRKTDYSPSSALEMVFVFRIPKSWSKKKAEAMKGQPHQQRPDLDNLVKAIQDAIFNGKLAEEDDGSVHKLIVRKVWGDVGKIGIRNL